MKLNKPLYYILNCSWGIIMTAIGAIVAFGLIITGHKPKRHAGSIYFNVGEHWGGMEAGLFFFTDRSDTASTKNHEFGHSLQNCLWGPLLIPVISIPSCTRYWLRECKTQKTKRLFAGILALIVGVIGISLLVVSYVTQYVWLNIMMWIFIVYLTIIEVWLQLVEIPKYENKKTVPYDSIWFEGQATEWGTAAAKIWTE